MATARLGGALPQSSQLPCGALPQGRLEASMEIEKTSQEPESWAIFYEAALRRCGELYAQSLVENTNECSGAEGPAAVREHAKCLVEEAAQTQR